MVRRSRVQLPREREALSNPVVAAATLMVDVHEDGTVTAMIGRMDMASRRYVFDTLVVESAVRFVPRQLPLAVFSAGAAYMNQWAGRSMT